MNTMLKNYHCPSTGQPCIRGCAVFDRKITIRRWTGGNVKASVCTLECAERWAHNCGYVATGVSEIHGKGEGSTIVIVQHPDQVHNSIKIKKKE